VPNIQVKIISLESYRTNKDRHTQPIDRTNRTTEEVGNEGNKDELSLTKPRGALHHGERAANK